jgi:hypothetical protein
MDPRDLTQKGSGPSLKVSRHDHLNRFHIYDHPLWKFALTRTGIEMIPQKQRSNIAKRSERRIWIVNGNAMVTKWKIRTTVLLGTDGAKFVRPIVTTLLSL